MTWRRLGRVWGPDASQPWARSHAALPFPVRLDEQLYRIFFSARDGENRSAIGWIDVVVGDKPWVERVGEAPVLGPASPGHFDDSGLGLGSIIESDEGWRLYYMGWNLGKLAPWRNSIGMAVGDPAAPAFERAYAGPIMDRAPDDPYTLSYPWVMRFAERDWRMWYGSNLAWGGSSADMEHAIKEARSEDGVVWRREAAPVLGFADETEYAHARPCVIREGDRLTMWFAARGERYHIAAAVRDGDGDWTRADDALGLTSEGGGDWDGEMVCYPCVFDTAGGRFLLYNGNAYGRDGFGLAIWDEG